MNVHRSELNFPAIAAAVARELLGDPNPALSTPTELRFGTRGSLSLDLKRAVFYDHESNTGGGLLWFISREIGGSRSAAMNWLRERGFIGAEQGRDPQRRPQIVETYSYVDEAGELLFEVVRRKPKDFRQRAPDGRGGWRWSIKGIRRVLYRLPEILAAAEGSTVFVVEGERDADRLASLGLVATTCPGGAGKWRAEYGEALAGRQVVILPDNDDPGRNHAEAVQKALRGAGVVCGVLTLDGLPPKGDVSDWLNAGGTSEALVALAEAALHEGSAAEAPRRNLDLIGFDDDGVPLLEDAWLVEDIIPDEGLGVGYGAPGCGKTYVLLDLAFAIGGAATEWRGKYIEHGSVLYFGMEGGRKFRNRVAAYMQEKGRAPYFYRSGVTLNLRSTKADAEAIIEEAERIAEAGPPVKFIVVDTLSRAMAGGNENASEDMSSFVALCEMIRKEIGCFLLVVHHSGKDSAKGMRGHSSLLGAVDTELHLERSEAGGLLTVSKQREGEDGEQFGYCLRSVVLGASPRGKAITACVVEDAAVSAPKPSLGSAQRITLEALRQYVDDHGEPCPGGTGWPEAGSRRAVSLDGFMPFLVDKMTNPKPDDRRRTAKRTFDDLIKKGLVQINEGRAWIV